MELSLLLVGRDGNGKSSTGNSILGDKPFTPTSNSSSVGVDIQHFSATVDGRKVTVTEVAGLEYPGADNAGDIEDTLKKIKETITVNRKGFNAVIIVLKYGVRFTKQEKDALQVIRSIFGSNVFKDFGIVVMTNGDCFDLDVEDDKRTFEKWCQDQTGGVRTLFDDCEGRCVLFNNRTKDKDKMEAQRQKLFSVIEGISHLYTLDEYRKAFKGQTEILVQSKLPEVEKHKNDVMSKVWTELDKIDKKYSAAFCDVLELARLLSNMEEKLVGLKMFISDKDKGTEVLQHLLYDIPIAEMRIQTKRQIVEQNLQILASSATMVVCFLDGSEYGLQKITDTITIRECSIDKDGNICCMPASGKGVSGYCMALVEICKSTSSSQQVTETLDLHDKLSHSGEVSEVFDQVSPPKGTGHVAQVQGHGSNPKDERLLAEVKGQDPQPKVEGQVTADKGKDSQPKVEGQVTADKGKDPQPKVEGQVTADKGKDPQPKVEGQVTAGKGKDSQPKVEGQVTADKGKDPQPKVEGQVTADKDKDPQPKVEGQVTADKGKDPQPKVEGQVTADKGKDSQPKVERQVTADKGKDSQPKVEGQVTADKGKDPQPKVEGQVTKDKGKDPQPKVEGQVTKDKGQDSQPKVEGQVIANKGKDPEPKVEGEVTADKGQDSQPKVEGQVTADKGQAPQPKVEGQVTADKGKDPQPINKGQVTADKGQDPQPKDKGHVTKVKGHAGHSKPNNDLEITQKMFKKISKYIKLDKLTHVICLISKYEQKLTKEEIDVIIEKVKTTYGTNEIKDHSVLILTCDKDNLEAEKAQMLEDWRKEETGANQQLLNACGNRCVLLNPATIAGSGTGNASKNAEAHCHNALMATGSASSKPNTAPEKPWYSDKASKALNVVKGLKWW